MRLRPALLLLPILAACVAACEDQPWHPGLEAEIEATTATSIPRCTEPPTELPPTPARVAEAPTYLVWQEILPSMYAEPEPSAPHHQTTWIRAGETGPEILGATTGLLLTHGSRVYRWVSEPVEFRAVSCEGMEVWDDEEVPPGAWHTLTDRASWLVPLGGGPSIPVHRAKSGRVEDTIEEHDRNFVVTGTLGPYLFTEELLYTYNCGAHGGVQAYAKILDLRTGKPVQLAPRMDEARFTAVWPDVRAALVREDPDETWSAPSGASDVALTALQPRLEHGRIHLAQQLTVDTCYACSDGDWSSYSLSVQLPLEAPPALRDYLQVPLAVQDHLGEPDEGVARGFTAVTTDAALATLRDVLTPAV
jgi:hypothetical protein